nr:hypothetical protein [uncultured Desulfobacter sp.]
MAVREINLVPGDVLEKNIRSRHLWFWGKGLILLMVGLCFAWLVQYRIVDLQKKALPPQRFTGDQVAASIKAISELQDRITAIQEKNRSLSRMARRQMVDIIAEIAACMNDRTWLTRLSVERDREKKQISLLVCEGMSWDHRSLGRFLDRLAQAPGIEQVVLEDAGKPVAAGLSKTDRDRAGQVDRSADAVRFRITAVTAGAVQR